MLEFATAGGAHGVVSNDTRGPQSAFKFDQATNTYPRTRIVASGVLVILTIKLPPHSILPRSAFEQGINIVTCPRVMALQIPVYSRVQLWAAPLVNTHPAPIQYCEQVLQSSGYETSLRGVIKSQYYRTLRRIGIVEPGEFKTNAIACSLSAECMVEFGSFG